LERICKGFSRKSPNSLKKGKKYESRKATGNTARHGRGGGGRTKARIKYEKKRDRYKRQKGEGEPTVAALARIS
jgi:hypothetical protein